MILRHPGLGTVVECEGDLATLYRSRGWADVNAPAEPVEVQPEKPKRARSRKSD